MTLEDLKSRCKEAGIKFAYGKFEKPTEPPHLVAIFTSTENFMADNIVYSKNIPIKLDYTYLVKDFDMQDKIENIILKDVAWEKSDENYFSNEEIWQVSYYFDI